jgi:hypothetical protein
MIHKVLLHDIRSLKVKLYERDVGFHENLIMVQKG